MVQGFCSYRRRVKYMTPGPRSGGRRLEDIASIGWFARVFCDSGLHGAGWRDRLEPITVKGHAQMTTVPGRNGFALHTRIRTTFITSQYHWNFQGWTTIVGEVFSNLGSFYTLFFVIRWTRKEIIFTIPQLKHCTVTTFPSTGFLWSIVKHRTDNTTFAS